MAITINATAINFSSDSTTITTAPKFVLSVSGTGVTFVANNNNGTGNSQFKILTPGTFGIATITTTANVVTITGI